MFISPSFTTYQKEAINFKDLPIELWEFKRYSNQTVNYNQIKTSGSQESIKTVIQQNATIEKVSKEIKVYTESDLLDKATDHIKELYEQLKNAVLNFEGIEMKPRKHYIAFVSDSNILDIQIQKNALKIWLNMQQDELNDPKEITRNVSSVGHLGNGDYEISMRTEEDFEYILSLIKQTLNKNNK